MTRTAIVTGGTAGVGRAVVDALIARGCRVGVLARGEERLEELQRVFGRRRLLGVSCDVADAGAVSQAAREIREEFGPPAIWVNAAMLTAYSPFREMPPAEFDAIVGATFLGQVNGTRAALEVMTRGSIVNVGSGLSYRAVPMQSAYVAAKHAINGFTQSLRSELMREGVPIALSLVQLPAINTPQFGWARNRMGREPQPVPPAYQPEVAARAVLRAIDGGHREILVGAPVLKLMLGELVAPWLLDRQFARQGVEMQRSDRPEDEPGGNLDAPVPMPSRARGDFGEGAREGGLILDADRVRAALTLGVPALAFAAGLLSARATRSPPSDRARRPLPAGPRRAADRPMAALPPPPPPIRG